MSATYSAISRDMYIRTNSKYRNKPKHIKKRSMSQTSIFKDEKPLLKSAAGVNLFYPFAKAVTTNLTSYRDIPKVT